ncbi:MAG: methyltransferase [Chryseolinea sp.]
MKKKISNASFQFKQFVVHHDRCTMKVGTDAVLLGAWVNVNHVNRILDIGAGSGVIALMLAQRSSEYVHIDAVEIGHQDALQAKENIHNSPWPNRISIYEVPIQQFQSETKYDLIISNPPYFNNSFQPPDKKRLHTRHTVSLDFNELLLAVAQLLKPDGRFNVILPFTEGLEFIGLASQHTLYCSRQWSFRSRNEKPIERLLLEFRLQSSKKEEGEIVHYKETEEWAEDYKMLTKDFYLKL